MQSKKYQLPLTLGVVLLNLVCTFANGFDMDLYLQKFCSSIFCHNLSSSATDRLSFCRETHHCRAAAGE